MAEPRVTAFPIDLNPPAGTPTGVWDPIWDRPEVAASLALSTYRRLRHLPFDGCTLLPEASLPELAHKHTVARTFAVARATPVEEFGVRFRGGSFGEIFKRYSFGPMPAANFHAQAVYFGADSDGRFLVEATVGLVGGTLDNEAALVVRFTAASGVVGGVAWEGPVKSEHNTHLQILGTDPTLAQAFDELDRVEVQFYARCPGA